MDLSRFDDFTRRIAVAPSRRQLVGLTLGGVLGALDHLTGASAQSTSEAATPTAQASVCATTAVPDLQSKAPGDLVAFEEITPEDDQNFPRAARAWRVLYVSTNRDNTERVLVCGVVIAPADASRLSVHDAGGVATGRAVAWCHGTLGVVRRCQPSEQPATEIWGRPPYGINQVAWGSETRGDVMAGDPQDGILAGMIDKGWLVAATDYASDFSTAGALQPFVLGKIEAANIIDSVRAAHHLLAEVYDGFEVAAYDVVTWGHSQGGHAAMWAGQLLSSYEAATKSAGSPALALSGVALEAPASNFVVNPEVQGEGAIGSGLFDWVAHTTMELTSIPNPIPIGPFLFSYVFGSWSQHAAGGASDPSSMPAYPDTGPLDLAAIVTPQAVETIGQMTNYCWADGAPIGTLASPYLTTPFLAPALSDGPTINGSQHGNFDRACSSDPPPELAAWCSWFRYNNPGPLGDNPFDKLPARNGELVPVLITAGANDGVVHCVAPDPTADAIPSANDCVPIALFDALRTEYCPSAGDQGHLELLIWREVPGVTVADHSDVTGLVAAASLDDLRFEGSPLERFISGAFDGTLTPGCTETVGNGSSQA